MNEPLITSPREMPFSGKSFNKHPQWYNQPLRLTKEQKRNPQLILNEFFQCYHLNETRQILWEWFTEVVSSTRSVSIEGNDRSNHVFFYEKIEEVIEAAYLMKNRSLKRRFRKQKQRNRKTESNIYSQRPNIEFLNKEITQNKSKQLFEYINEAPVYVITEVFKEEPLSCFSAHLRNWLQIALADESSIYEVEEQRQQLIVFHDELQIFVEALFVFCSRNTDDNAIKKKIAVTKFRLLKQDQIANPMAVITAFYKKFLVTYILRELNDWLEAGISYTGAYPETMSELQALHTYRSVLCLVRSADRIIQRM